MPTGRNDPCPCGSGKKFKKCCLNKGQSAPANRPVQSQRSASGRPSALATRPAATREPPDPLEEKWDACWQEFKSKKGEERAAVFLRILDDEELMIDESALSMLEYLHRDAAESNQRPRFAELIAALAERRPDVYQEGAHHYIMWKLQEALADGRPDISPLVRELADRAGRNIDTVNQGLRALAYHGQLALLIEAMRIGWPAVKASDKILPWAISDFAERGCKYEICSYLEHTTCPGPPDAALLEHIKFFIPDPSMEHTAQFRQDLLGQDLPNWSVDDFALQPPRNRSRGAWDDDDDDRDDQPDPALVKLSRLTFQFMGYLRREENVPFTKGELIREDLVRYFLKRHDGSLNPRLSMLEQAVNPKKKLPPPPKPGHPLCPEAVTLEVNLGHLVGVLNGLYYTATALFELVPAWLRFLELRGLIDSDRHAKTLEDLRPIHPRILELMASYTDDPTLHRNLQDWPRPGKHAIR